MDAIELVEVTIVHEMCGTCGIHFGLEKKYRQNRIDQGRRFYCPNGCHVSYGETTTEKLRKQLYQANQETKYAKQNALYWQETAEENERRRIAQKGVTTKLKKRIQVGVCPCCKRSFQNLRRHMASKHPDYNPED